MCVRRGPFGLSHELAQAAGLRCHLDTGATLFAREDGMRLLSGCRDANVRESESRGSTSPTASVALGGRYDRGQAQ